MKHLLILLAVLGFFSISANSVLACHCKESRVPICAQYWRADAVFVGQVRGVTKRDPKSKETWPTATVHLIVEQAFRGVAVGTVDIGTLYGTSCDIKFQKGKRYLIYAVRDSNSKQLFAGPCMGTGVVENGDDAELDYIRSVTQQEESISGRVVIRQYEAVSDAKVVITKDNKTFEAITDYDGDFSATVSGPGAYKVRLTVPSSMGVLRYEEDPVDKVEQTDALTTIEYEVNVGKNQCYYRQLDLYRVDLHATAQVSGTLINALGDPVGNGLVRLISATDPDDYDFERTKADGSFKFERVAPGEYFLALNPKNEAPTESDPPYGSAYYPNATDEPGATRIVVVEGAKLENLTLRAGKAWKAKTVSGQVVWRDGSPARDVSVSLYNDGHYVRLVKVDKKGMFSFEVYGDFRYSIDASTRDTSGKSERIPIADKSTNLKVVLIPRR